MGILNSSKRKVLMSIISSFNNIISNMQQACTREQIEYCCTAFCEHAGFDHYLLYGSVFSSLLSPPSYIFGDLGKTVPNKKRQLQKITQACMDSSTPIITGNFSKDSILDNSLIHPLSSPLKNQLAINFPVHFPMGKFAYLHISTNTDKVNDDEKIISTLASGNLFAKQAGTAILNLLESDLENKPPYLNGREKECLLLAADGSTPQQIGKLVGLSHHTVTFHLGKAREKLATKNIPGAVSKAILRGDVKTIIGSEHN